MRRGLAIEIVSVLLCLRTGGRRTCRPERSTRDFDHQNRYTNRERGRSRAYVLTGHANARTSERIVCVPERAHVGQRIDSRTSTIVCDRWSESLDEHARMYTSAGHACARTLFTKNVMPCGMHSATHACSTHHVNEPLALWVRVVCLPPRCRLPPRQTPFVQTRACLVRIL